MSDGATGKTGPLDGLRVIDWTMWQFGPVSTMMLADMGAEVIKVESLDGDHGRQFEGIRGHPTKTKGGLSAYFEGLNRQKLGIALDLKNPRGLKVMRELAAKSDIFVQNFRKGVAERLALEVCEVLGDVHPFGVDRSGQLRDLDLGSAPHDEQLAVELVVQFPQGVEQEREPPLARGLLQPRVHHEAHEDRRIGPRGGRGERREVTQA